ncbi:DUF1801 domain-containing protein [Paludisphaera soli]|uniref:DUF1801 domain-containing protein n=1 Tax=Paludisphaera soli TaxID=2712865 RepID=UPI0013EC97EB|nr:DUF1801 domain-containing protein [Paludisphaera soli]
MARSRAATVEAYLAELPESRRAVVAAIRDLILENLPDGYREAMNWGMISYEVPLERYPDTYNKQPLSFAALAAQKSHYAIYLNAIDVGGESEASLRAAFAEAGKKLDMGKSCVRFQGVDDLALDAIARVIAGTPVETFIARYEASRRGR